MARLSRRIAAVGMAAYKRGMFASAHGRLWRVMLALSFLLATVMPAMAAHQPQAAFVPCSGGCMAGGDVSDCSGQADKTMPCGAVTCTAPAIEAAERVAAVERAVSLIAFPPSRPCWMAGATRTPDPFPPRTRVFA